MMMGAHVVVFSEDPEADRALVRDVLGLPGVDAGGGWMIFKLPPSEVAVHPPYGDNRTELHFLCEDIVVAATKLAEHGITCDPVQDFPYGLQSGFALPGGTKVGVYQPKHDLAINLPD